MASAVLRSQVDACKLGAVVPDDVLDNLWTHTAQVGKGDYIDNRVSAQVLFERYTGINPNAHEPYEYVMMNPNTDFLTGSSLEKTIMFLIENKIPEATQTSVDDLLDLPTYMFRMYIESVVRAAKKESEAIDNAVAAEEKKKADVVGDKFRGKRSTMTKK